MAGKQKTWIIIGAIILLFFIYSQNSSHLIARKSFYSDTFGQVTMELLEVKGASRKTINISPTSPKPGDAMTVTLLLEIPYSASGLGKVQVDMKKYTSQSSATLLDREIVYDYGQYTGCTSCSIQLKAYFTAPATSGTYAIEVYGWNGAKQQIFAPGMSGVGEMEKSFTVQSVVTTCPTAYCGGWSTLYRTTDGHGDVNRKTCYTYGSAPTCSESVSYETKTYCDSGYYITGTTSTSATGVKTCSLPASVCTPNWQCTNFGTCSESNTQTRTCTDANSCGVLTGKPAESQACTVTTTCVKGEVDGSCNGKIDLVEIKSYLQKWVLNQVTTQDTIEVLKLYIKG